MSKRDVGGHVGLFYVLDLPAGGTRRSTRRLSPAFDMIWACNPTGKWTNRHQMRINGKQDGFERADLLTVADQFGIHDVSSIIEQVDSEVGRWPDFAADAGVPNDMIMTIGATHRRDLA